MELPALLTERRGDHATCSATITGKVQLALKELATDPTVPVLKKKSVMRLESAAATALASVAAAGTGYMRFRPAALAKKDKTD